MIGCVATLNNLRVRCAFDGMRDGSLSIDLVVEDSFVSRIGSDAC